MYYNYIYDQADKAICEESSAYETALGKLSACVGGGAEALSYKYYNTNMAYRRWIEFAASMSLYQHLTIPGAGFNEKKKSHAVSLDLAIAYADGLNLPINLHRVVRQVFLFGKYAALVYQHPSLPTQSLFYDLDTDFCRSRKSGIFQANVLEVSLRAFQGRKMSAQDAKILPKYLIRALEKNGSEDDTWVEIERQDGVYFNLADEQPFFLPMIPLLENINDHIRMDRKKYQQELTKLMVNKVPMDKNGLYDVSPEEVTEINKTTDAVLLKAAPNVKQVTTPFDSEVYDVQTTKQGTIDPVAKAKEAADAGLGISPLVFGGSSSGTALLSIENINGVVQSLLMQCSKWVEAFLSIKVGGKSKSAMSIGFMVLPTTRYDWEKRSQNYRLAAQSCGSKLLSWVSDGIPQQFATNLLKYEMITLAVNDYIAPLSSSYTQPADAGAPTQDTVSDKTVANSEA